MSQRPLDRVPPQVLAVAAIFSVQFGSAFARTFFDEVGSMGAAALRLFFGCIILAAIVRPRVRAWKRATWLRVIALGLALAGMNSFIYLAIDHIPIGVAVTVEFLGPLAVALVQTRKLADAAWAVLALVGVLLLGFDPSGELEWIGLVLAALAALFWVGYILMSSRLGADADGVAPLAVAMVVAAIVVVPIGAPTALSAVILDPRLLLIFGPPVRARVHGAQAHADADLRRALEPRPGSRGARRLRRAARGARRHPAHRPLARDDSEHRRDRDGLACATDRAADTVAASRYR
jgi:inner membrane transporter RhtA